MNEITINIMDMPDGGLKITFSDDIETDGSSPAHNLAGILHLYLSKLMEDRDESQTH